MSDNIFISSILIFTPFRVTKSCFMTKDSQVNFASRLMEFYLKSQRYTNMKTREIGDTDDHPRCFRWKDRPRFGGGNQGSR